ncbi:MAG: nucleotidyltransferase domain-containing protein [Kineosporiaceae bacterium]
MRAVPADLDPAVVAAIDARLDGVEAQHGVAVGWAVESGSRAWGFPSPDSDYDCRFLYLRPVADHLTAWPRRDVIETPLDAVLDVNGWDLRKAMGLLVAGNATVVEWLRSPIVYRGEPGLRELLLELADQVVRPEAIARHYWHLGRNQWRRLGAGDTGTAVKVKGLFYALRPAAALHWLHAHPGRGVVPMRLQDLLQQAPPPAAVAEEVAALVERKARTRELGRAPVPDAVRDFVERWLLGEPPPALARGPEEVQRARRLAEEAYRGALQRFGPATPAFGAR